MNLFTAVFYQRSRKKMNQTNTSGWFGVKCEIDMLYSFTSISADRKTWNMVLHFN